ncbi:replication/maintenance protein RepL [Clostridium sp.]|jgi:hypothetical protein|uniref:Plasmid replication protein RepL domain-containing protein n=1 Tax=uncultured prokaryote TaxID=198431 RepID=A0A0H5Q285_9ZZZZ|nr:hypothetical protein [uncultured prokaryote]
MYDDKNKTKFITRETIYKDESGEHTLQETEIYKKIYGSQQFWKIYLSDFLNALGLINNNKQLDVLFHVLENTDQASNIYIGTYQKITKEMDVSYQTVAIIFKKMQENNLITKIQNGVYKVNPSIMVKGGESKRQRLVVEYESLKANNTEEVE